VSAVFEIIAPVLVSTMFTAMLVFALCKKKAFFGGPPALVFPRKDKPFQYWSIVCVLMIATAVSLLVALAKIRSLLTS
jgi:hypothetical protein